MVLVKNKSSKSAIIGNSLIARLSFIFTAIFLVAVFFILDARAATPPPYITYQGRLYENTFAATTTKNIKFVIYDASSGGTALYTAGGTLGTPTAISVLPVNGLFTVYLGDTGTNALDPIIFQNNSTLYLEVEVNGEILSPRKRIISSPFAFNAKYLDGVAATSTASSSTYIPISDAVGNFRFNRVTSTGLISSGTSTLATTTISSSSISSANIGNGIFSNATSTNLAVSGNTSLGNTAITNATTTNFAATGNTNLGNTIISNVTTTNLNVSGLTSLLNYTFGSATGTNLNLSGAFSFATANGTSVTSTNLFASNAVFTGATTTNFYSSLINAINGNFTSATSTNFYASNLAGGSANFTSLGVTGATNLGNTTITNATTTNFYTSLFGALNGVFTSLTTTNFSATNLGLTNINAANLTSTNIYNSGQLVSGGTSTFATTTISSSTIGTANITNLNVQNCIGCGTGGGGSVGTSTVGNFAYYNNTTGVTGTPYMTASGNTIAFNTNTTFTTSTFNSSTIGQANLTNAIIGSATSTNLAVSGNTNLGNTIISNATTTNLNVSGQTTLLNYTFGSATGTNLNLSGAFSFATANGTSITSTNIFASNAVFTGATTTNFYSSLVSAVNGNFTSVTTTNLSVVNFNPTNINASNITSTNLYATNLVGNSLVGSGLQIQSTINCGADRALMSDGSGNVYCGGVSTYLGGARVIAGPFGNPISSTTTNSTSVITNGPSLLLAFIATERTGGATPMAVNSVVGGGLTWQKAAGGADPVNSTYGTEIWYAYAPTTLTNVVVTSTVNNPANFAFSVVALDGVNTTSPIGVTLGPVSSTPATNLTANFAGTQAGSLMFLTGFTPGAGTPAAGTNTAMIANQNTRTLVLRSKYPSLGGTMTLAETGYTTGNVYYSGVEIKASGQAQVYSGLNAISTSTFLGSIGVGTNTPNANFEVVGNKPLSGNSSLIDSPAEVLAVYNNSTKILNAGITSSGHPLLDLFGYLNVQQISGTGGAGSDLILKPNGSGGQVAIVDSNGTTPLLSVLNGGNVGIGTSTPQTRFVVIGTSTLATTTISSSSISQANILNAIITNVTTTNLAATGNTNLGNTIVSNATSTNLAVSGNTNLGNTIISNATTTNLNVSGQTTLLNYTFGSATGTNLNLSGAFSFATANGTSVTSTNLFASNAVFTGATTTNFYSSLVSAVNGSFTSITTTNFYASYIPSVLVGSATSTNLFATNTNFINVTTTNLSATNFNPQNINTTNLTSTNGVFTSLTTTNFSVGSFNPTNINATNITSTNFYNSGQFILASTSSAQRALAVGTTTPSEKLHVYNGTLLIDNPINPKIVGSVSTTALNQSYGVAVSGKYAYVASKGNDTLNVIDISDPTRPTTTGFTDYTLSGAPSAGAAQVQVVGKYAYMATPYNTQFVIFDISNPKSPTTTGYLNDAQLGESWDLRVVGKYAYVLNYTGGTLLVIDVSNPVSPKIISTITDSRLQDGASLDIDGRYAYVAAKTAGLVTIVDILNPLAPTIVGSTAVTGASGTEDIYVSGRFAYTKLNGGFAIVDVSNPTAPTTTGKIIDTIFNGSGSVKVSGKYAYVMSDGNDTMSIIDISSSTNPIVKTTYSMPGTNPDPDYLEISGKYLYITSVNNNSLYVLDVGGADITNANIGRIATNDLTVWDDASVGNNLIVRNTINAGGGIQTDGSIGAYATSTFYRGVVIGTTTLNKSAKLFIDAGTSTNYGLAINGFARASGGFFASTTLDLAERYPIDLSCYDNNTCPKAGDVVCQIENTSTISVEKCSTPYNRLAIGIVSTDPGFVLEGGFTEENSRKIALAGRVPIRVSAANGSIKPGDLLTSSAMPGIAVKATAPGIIVGKALENYSDTSVNGYIIAYVQLGYNGSISSSTSTSSTIPVGDQSFIDMVLNVLKQLGTIIEQGVLRVTNLFAKKVITDEMCVGNTCVNESQLIELLNKNNITPSAATQAPVAEGAATDVPAQTEVEVVTTTPESETVPTSTPEAVVPETVPPDNTATEPPPAEEAPAPPPSEETQPLNNY